MSVYAEHVCPGKIPALSGLCKMLVFHFTINWKSKQIIHVSLICLSVCPSIRPSVRPSIHPFIYLFIYLSIYLSIIHLSVCLSIYLSSIYHLSIIYHHLSIIYLHTVSIYSISSSICILYLFIYQSLLLCFSVYLKPS